MTELFIFKLTLTETKKNSAKEHKLTTVCCFCLHLFTCSLRTAQNVLLLYISNPTTRPTTLWK